METPHTACLSAIGLAADKTQAYLANAALGSERANDQIALLLAHDEQLADQQRRLAAQRDYVQLEVRYWAAVRARDEERAQRLRQQADSLADHLDPSQQ